LHLDLGLRSHFELLCSSLLEEICATLRAAGLVYGFGGIGRAGDESLPISSDLVYAQYPRLGVFHRERPGRSRRGHRRRA